ncbi:MAG TPA: hypothetical protein VHN36_15035 [Ilumatobacteraceae bacterium]|nr:hypothetical protein [Ilumatobacteraceae bacterium]
MTTPGFFQLYPAARPALPAGDYTATSNQKLVAQTPHDGPQQIPVDDTEFHLVIDAPRYKMPPDQILSTFPPAGSQGDWRERLPQIVLKRRTLPWERNPDPAHDPHTSPPWLALVVLADGEGQLSSDVDVSQCVTSDVNLGNEADVPRGKYLSVTKDIVEKVFPCRDELDLLCHVRKVDLRDTELALGDDDGFLAVVIANRLPQPAAPKTDDQPALPLKYTAYLINLEHQLDKLLATEPNPVLFFDATAAVSLVDSELLAPAPNATIDQIAMKIGPAAPVLAMSKDAKSLSPTAALPAPFAAAKGIESAAAAWATGPSKEGASISNAYADAKAFKAGVFNGDIVRLMPVYRFPVLVSWEFTCTGEGGFERLMNALQVGMLGTAVDEDAAGHPIGAPPPGLEVAATGHVALSHRTRRGEAARSWYRGPLTPQPTVRAEPVDGVLPLAHTGDQLRKLVPDGREDISLAALFEIGRLLTLNKPTLVASLMHWRRELFGAARARQLADLLANQIVAGIGLGVAGGRSKLEDLVRASVVGAYASENGLAPAAPEVTAARVPDELLELAPEQMLAGLGVSASVVARLGKQFGVDGLSSVPIAVAMTPKEPATGDKQAMVVLNQTLSERIDQLVISALKVSDVPHAVGRPTRSRKRDDLDRLLAEAAERVATGRRD